MQSVKDFLETFKGWVGYVSFYPGGVDNYPETQLILYLKSD